MLKDIIANFLRVSSDKAEALIELLNIEGRWQQESIWKDIKIHPSQIETQADLFNFLQAVGQSQWFKGHDRSKFPENILKSLTEEKYFNLLASLGMTQAIPYDSLKGHPDISIVLGSSESQVNARVSELEKDLIAGNLPRTNMICGLSTSSRKLGVSVIEKEDISKAELEELKQDPTEVNMVNLKIETMLSKLKKEIPNFNNLIYKTIDTASTATSREDVKCVKTSDTASSLKQLIESQPEFARLKKPIIVAAYSCQPFVERQRRDVQKTLGDDCLVVGVGSALTFETFKQHSQSISICLGEVGRLINISYVATDLVLAKSQKLTQEELAEIANFFSPKPLAETKQKELIAKPEIVAQELKGLVKTSSSEIKNTANIFQKLTKTSALEELKSDLEQDYVIIDSPKKLSESIITDHFGLGSFVKASKAEVDLDEDKDLQFAILQSLANEHKPKFLT